MVKLRLFSVFALALLMVAGAAHAQTLASLIGEVTSGGSPLPGVTVTISSPQMQGSRTAVTSDNGSYSFPGVPPGTYTVKFELTGMGDITRTVKLGLGQTARENADMKVTAVAEAITVTAAAPTVLETPQVSTNMTLKEVEKLPVARNQVATALLAPGVSGNTPSGLQFQISGSPGYDNLVLVNGVVVSENVRSQARPLYVEDAIQETTVMTGAISAEYGRFTGGVVNSITKSGGNVFSGSYRDNLSSPKWVAQTPALERRLKNVNQVHEATLGGYFLKDRLWFFGAGRKQETSTSLTTFPVPAFSGSGVATGTGPISSYSSATMNDRYEIKLTGQVTSKHTLVGSYFKIKAHATNTRFTTVYDMASLTDRDDPESLRSGHYNGILTPNLLLEGQYSRRTQAFQNNGSKFTDLNKGTILIDRSNNVRYNSPTFCGVCDTETRNNREVAAKASYFLSTKGLGTHNIIAGASRFQEGRYANNFQSGSNFRIFVSRTQYANGQIYPVAIPTSATGGNTFIRWTPIFVGANESDLKTDSLYVNDKWDFNNHWTFNIGFRWDKNDAVDGSGNVASKDKRITPRAGVYYDVRGDGRHRFSASYGQYASHIIETVASSNNSAGNPATIDFAYKGPAINTTVLDTPLDAFVTAIFNYFNTVQGGTANLVANLRPGVGVGFPGYNTYFLKDLETPYVDEWTLGYGTQIGNKGYVKLDYIRRDWHAFYAQNLTANTRKSTTQVLPNGTTFNIPIDLGEIVNSDRIKRQYRGLQMQARWNPSRYQLGINYTFATLKGNAEVESANSGPGAVANPGSFFPELLTYRNWAPMGYLSGDQRHRVRAFAGLDLPVPAMIGTLGLSVLHSFDTGTPYSTSGTIDVRGYTGAPTVPAGYKSPIATGTYFFSKRGENRLPATQSTDFALRWARPIYKFEIFAQADVLNAFNRKDALTVNQSVFTSTTSGRGLSPFNPFTQTPIECPATSTAAQCQAMGAHFQKGLQFGTTPIAQANFQTPRTFRGSVGFRF